ATSPCSFLHSSINCSVSALRCEREATMVYLSYFSVVGNLSAFSRSTSQSGSSCLSSKLIEKLPNSSAAKYSVPETGIYTTPATGTPLETSAIFTVNSPFLLINSLVPSNGSTIQQSFQSARRS